LELSRAGQAARVALWSFHQSSDHDPPLFMQAKPGKRASPKDFRVKGKTLGFGR